MNDARTPVLEFEKVVLAAGRPEESSLAGVSFSLRPGELLLVLLDREHIHLPLADAACGLAELESGVVRFEGRDWRKMRVDEAAAARGRIGRLFDEECWVTNLDMDENLMLAQRHHTRRGEADLREEAAALARDFLLPGLPLGKPGGFRRQDLQKAACVRAFMGRPALILLERPTHNVYADVLPALVNAVFAARRRGAALVWTTENRRVWEDQGLNASQRARVAAAQWHWCENDDKAISISACQ